MKGVATPVVIGIILVAVAAVAIYYTIGPGAPGKVFSTGTGGKGEPCEIRGGYLRGVTVKDNQYLIYGSKVYLCKNGTLSPVTDVSARLASAKCPALIKDGGKYKVVDYAPGSIVCTKNPTSYKACPTISATQGKIGRLLIYPYMCKGSENFYWKCTPYGWKYVLGQPKEVKETLSEDIAESEQEIKARDECDELKDAMEKYKVPCEGVDFWLERKFPEDDWNGYSHVKVEFKGEDGVRVASSTRGVPADILPGDIPCYGINWAWCFPREAKFLMTYGVKKLVEKSERELEDLLGYQGVYDLTDKQIASVRELTGLLKYSVDDGFIILELSSKDLNDGNYLIYGYTKDGKPAYFCTKDPDYNEYILLRNTTDEDIEDSVWPDAYHRVSFLRYLIHVQPSITETGNLALCNGNREKIADLDSTYEFIKEFSEKGYTGSIPRPTGGVVFLDRNLNKWYLGLERGGKCEPMDIRCDCEHPPETDWLAYGLTSSGVRFQSENLCLVSEDGNEVRELPYTSELVRLYRYKYTGEYADELRMWYAAGPVHVVCTEDEAVEMPMLCSGALAGDVYLLYSVDGNYKGYEVVRKYYRDKVVELTEDGNWHVVGQGEPKYDTRLAKIMDLIRAVKKQCQGICS